MTSASEEKWRYFNCFFSRVGLRTYQHPCRPTCFYGLNKMRDRIRDSLLLDQNHFQMSREYFHTSCFFKLYSIYSLKYTKLFNVGSLFNACYMSALMQYVVNGPMKKTDFPAVVWRKILRIFVRICANFNILTPRAVFTPL